MMKGTCGETAGQLFGFVHRGQAGVLGNLALLKILSKKITLL
jgi:hypothetical protein